MVLQSSPQKEFRKLHEITVLRLLHVNPHFQGVPVYGMLYTHGA